MHEIIVNLHMHTYYSDGHATHRQIAQSALRAGLDAVIVTDHNVLVRGVEGYYHEENKRVLLLVGEEIHDQGRQPQKSHLLVLGVNRELAHLAHDPERLLQQVNALGGLSFIAHPHDPPAPVFGEDDLSWEDWHLQGFTGLEIWNAMSEFKSLLKSKAHAIYYAYQPERVARGPFPQALRKWDELLAKGHRLVAIGGSDGHAMPARLGPLRRTIFPFEFHFRTVNTHLLLEAPLSGDCANDRRLIYRALQRGRAFIGYDLPAATRGFRFTAYGYGQEAQMGDEIVAKQGVTFQVRLPLPTECRLIRHGEVVQTWQNQQHGTYITTQPGAYRVEVYIQYLGQRRGWIFSNPIYVR